MLVPLLRWFDWPPVLTLACIAAVRAILWVTGPSGLGLGPWAALPLGLGLGLMAVAAGQMLWARTTLNPRAQPQRLVTGGVFRLTRNPIYLGDALVILAAVVWWDVPAGLLVLGGFFWIATHHYVAREERWLIERFGDAADHWFSRTRRWI